MTPISGVMISSRRQNFLFREVIDDVSQVPDHVKDTDKPESTTPNKNVSKKGDAKANGKGNANHDGKENARVDGKGDANGDGKEKTTDT